MKMYLISDNIDTLTGMRLAGVPGVVVHEKNELKEALETAFADPDIGIILLTEKFGGPACRSSSIFRIATAPAADRIS